MNQHQISKIASYIALSVSVYVAFVLFRDIQAVYSNALNWSGGNIMQSASVTVFVSASLLSVLVVSYVLHKGKHPYWVLVFLIHLVFVLPSIPVYALAVVVLIWLVSKHVLPTT
jgi:hypothetical protein